MKNAFVLSGGSIKGAFQAGALSDILTSNKFAPNAIYGTSVGSLNGAFIADRAGRAVAADEAPDWVKIGNELQEFWQKNITSFKQIGKTRNKVSLLFSIIAKKFKSLVEMSALYDIIKREFSVENLRKSPVDFYACAVNIDDGKAVYANAKTHENIHDYIIASTAIPIVMPLKNIKNGNYVDGGIREVAPLHKAIEDKATDIICIVCQTEEIKEKKVDWRNLTKLMGRHMDIVTNETVKNDLQHCEQINEILKHLPQKPTSGPLKDKRHINLLEIRPANAVQLDLEKFTKDQITQAMQFGWKTAQEARNNCDWI